MPTPCRSYAHLPMCSHRHGRPRRERQQSRGLLSRRQSRPQAGGIHRGALRPPGRRRASVRRPVRLDRPTWVAARELPAGDGVVPVPTSDASTATPPPTGCGGRAHVASHHTAAPVRVEQPVETCPRAPRRHRCLGPTRLPVARQLAASPRQRRFPSRGGPVAGRRSRPRPRTRWHPALPGPVPGRTREERRRPPGRRGRH